MRARLTLVTGGIVTALGLPGCRAAPDGAALFAEAEQLRLKYEKDASRSALLKYREAIVASERRGDRRGAARAGQGAGSTYRQLGLLHESRMAYRSALALAVDSPDRVLESELRSAVGVADAFVAEREQDFDRARVECETALALARAADTGIAEAKALNCLGDVAYHRLQPAAALERYREAGRLWDGLGDLRGQAETELYQGYVYSDLSQFDEARACYEKARSTWSALGDRREQAIVLVADARLQLRLGHYQPALDEFQTALALLRPMGDAVWEGSALTGIARVYHDMAEAGPALKYGERALEIFETAGLKQVAVDVSMSLGEMYLVARDDSKALVCFERALALADELGIERWRAWARRFIGVVYLFRRQPTEALQSLESSLVAQRSVQDPRLEGATRADLGEVRLLQDRPQLAAQSFDAALKLSRTARDRVTEVRGLFGLARTSAGVGDLEAARRHIEAALSVAEALRTATENRDLRSSYLASVYRYHDFHMDVLMRLHRARPGAGLASLAFEACERARARSLLDGLTEAGVDLRQGVDPDLLRRADELKTAFDDWADRQRRATQEPAANRKGKTLADEYRELEERYGEVQAEIRSRSPRYAALVQPQPLRLVEVQRQVVEPGTLLLEYALGEERSYLWAVSSTEYTAYELPPRVQIEQAARLAYGRLTARLAASGDVQARRQQGERADAEYWKEATRLSELLLGPVASRIDGKRILVVADGALQYVPFAALPVPGRGKPPVPMVVEHEIVSLPSATVLGFLRREARDRTPPPKAVAVFADPVVEGDDPRLRAILGPGDRRGRDSLGEGSPGFPRLMATRQEADAILATAPPAAETLRAIGLSASRATVMNPDLGRYKIVHFATHGVFDNESPGLSGVVLSMFDARGRAQDGFLRLHDIYGLKLPAELVVLSACDTALGKQVRGEGLVGVVRGFMHAGARRVVASLWKVDDEATGELMRVFYEEMLEKGRPPAEALRRAQLALRGHPRWREPYYWAAFVLQGEPT